MPGSTLSWLTWEGLKVVTVDKASVLPSPPSASSQSFVLWQSEHCWPWGWSSSLGSSPLWQARQFVCPEWLKDQFFVVWQEEHWPAGWFLGGVWQPEQFVCPLWLNVAPFHDEVLWQVEH